MPASSPVAGLLAAQRDLRTRPELVKQYLDDATAEMMSPFGYEYFLLNLLSVYGRERSVDDVRELALECVRRKVWTSWSYCRYWADMSHTGRVETRLENWRRDIIDNLMAGTKGMILVTAHCGDYRSIPSDLAILGYNVTVAVDASGATKRRQLMNQYPVRLAGRLKFLDVETNSHAPMQLLLALRRREIVVVVTDGNTGADGRWGGTNRVRLPFLGRHIVVKNGAIQLAAVAGVPVLGVIACSLDDNGGRVHYDDAVMMSRVPLAHDAVTDVIRDFYAWLEKWIARHPEQWDSANLFHRWRHLARDVVEDGTAVTANLSTERLLRLYAPRVLVLRRRSGINIVDVDTLRAWHLDASWNTEIRALESRRGIALRSLQSAAAGRNGALRHLCATLYAAGCLEEQLTADVWRTLEGAPPDLNRHAPL